MRLVFWDQSFHKKTRSSDFFLRLLDPGTEVIRVWDDLWRGGEQPSPDAINELEPDLIIFFQAIPPAHDVLKIRARKLWVPMWDAVWHLPDRIWRPYLLTEVTIVAFCRALHETVTRLGFRSRYWQYFPEPAARPPAEKSPKVFFWQRRPDVDWPVLRTLFRGQTVEQVIYKRDPDPGCVIDGPEEMDMDRFNVRVVEGWLPRAEYLSCLRECSMFIASRPDEGIGMANLEAMAQGMCVISPDRPTANEYIEHGVNGLLYDLDNPECLDLRRIHELGCAAWRGIGEGFGLWEHKCCEIREVINQSL